MESVFVNSRRGRVFTHAIERDKASVVKRALLFVCPMKSYNEPIATTAMSLVKNLAVFHKCQKIY